MFLFGLHEFLWWRHDVSGEWILGSIAIWALSPQYELVVLFIIYLRCSSAISFLLLTTQSMAIPWAYEELSLIPLVLAYHSFRWKFMLRPQLSFWIRSKKAGAPWELWMRSVPCFLLAGCNNHDRRGWFAWAWRALNGHRSAQTADWYGRYLKNSIEFHFPSSIWQRKHTHTQQQ